MPDTNTVTVLPADSIVKSAMYYPELLSIRAVVTVNGEPREVDWPTLYDGLPPEELPAGRGVRAFVAGGGSITQGSGIPAVPNYRLGAVDPSPAVKPYLTGRDVIDGMSPAQANAANAVDSRNLLRIASAAQASTVKSCMKRVAEANGITSDALLGQATPTGGT